MIEFSKKVTNNSLSFYLVSKKACLLLIKLFIFSKGNFVRFFFFNNHDLDVKRIYIVISDLNLFDSENCSFHLQSVFSGFESYKEEVHTEINISYFVMLAHDIKDRCWQ